jgi:hypothetical protein
MNIVNKILRKNQLHILIIEAEQKAKTKKQFKALETLTDSLLLINQQDDFIDVLNKEIRYYKVEHSKLMLKNAELKKEIRILNQQIKEHFK